MQTGCQGVVEHQQTRHLQTHLACSKVKGFHIVSATRIAILELNGQPLKWNYPFRVSCPSTRIQILFVDFIFVQILINQGFS